MQPDCICAFSMFLSLNMLSLLDIYIYLPCPSSLSFGSAEACTCVFRKKKHVEN